MIMNDIMPVAEYLDANPPGGRTTCNTTETSNTKYAPLTTISNISEKMQTYFRIAELYKMISKKHLYNEIPLVWDTGASIGLTPFWSDFIDYMKLENVSVKDTAQKNKVLGVGTVMWKFTTCIG